MTPTDPRFWFDGRWLAPGEPAFAPSSRLVAAGEGWFETLRVEKGRPMFLEAHLDRLSRSVAAGPGAEQADDALHIARRCLAAMQPSFNDFPVGRLRLLLAFDAVGEVWQALGEWGAHASSPTALDSGMAAVMASFPHPGLGWLGKSASYHWSMAARREALAHGAAEALLVRDGRVLEGSTGAVVWQRGGRWYAEDSPAVLPSVTLAALRACGLDIASAALHIDDLHPDRAGSAAARSAPPLEGLVLVSALRLAVAIRAVDGVALPTVTSLAAAAQWRDMLLLRHAVGDP
jgi:branched-chain amino acid aminotransferase